VSRGAWVKSEEKGGEGALPEGEGGKREDKRWGHIRGKKGKRKRKVMIEGNVVFVLLTWNFSFLGVSAQKELALKPGALCPRRKKRGIRKKKKGNEIVIPFHRENEEEGIAALRRSHFPDSPLLEEGRGYTSQRRKK